MEWAGAMDFPISIHYKQQLFGSTSINHGCE